MGCFEQPNVAGLYQHTESYGFSTFDFRPDGTATFIYERGGVTLPNNNLGSVVMKGTAEGKWSRDDQEVTFLGTVVYDFYKEGTMISEERTQIPLDIKFKLQPSGDLLEVKSNSEERSTPYIRQN